VSKAGSTRHTPFAYPKGEHSVQSSSFSSKLSIFSHPSSPICHTPNQLPPVGPTFFFFTPTGLTSLPFSLLFPSTHPRVQDRGLHAGDRGPPSGEPPRVGLLRRRIGDPRGRAAPPLLCAVCGGGPRGRAVGGSPSSPPPDPAQANRAAPAARSPRTADQGRARRWRTQVAPRPTDRGTQPPARCHSSSPSALDARWANAAAASPPPSSLSPFLQLRRRRAAISSSLLPRRYLSSVMARSNNRWTRWGPSEGVAHALECALFGACGMRTGHPVHRSARRCGVKNAKGVLEHSVPFPSQYLVLPA
jgi:hypothetical protein